VSFVGITRTTYDHVLLWTAPLMWPIDCQRCVGWWVQRPILELQICEEQLSHGQTPRLVEGCALNLPLFACATEHRLVTSRTVRLLHNGVSSMMSDPVSHCSGLMGWEHTASCSPWERPCISCGRLPAASCPQKTCFGNWNATIWQ